MKTFKILLSLVALFAMPAYGQYFHYEIGYTAVGSSESEVDLNLGGLYGAVGYDWNVSGNLAHSFEALVVVGVQNDSLFEDTAFAADINLEPTIELAYRGTMQTRIQDLSYFWRVSYARLEFEVEAFEQSASADESGAGFGLGVEWRGVTLGYTRYFGDLEDADRINIGYRF